MSVDLSGSLRMLIFFLCELLVLGLPSLGNYFCVPYLLYPYSRRSQRQNFTLFGAPDVCP